MDTIKYLKLVTGQELVATLEDENDVKVTLLADAAVVFLVAGKDGRGTAASIAPFAPFAAQKTIDINKQHIMFLADANAELASFYKQATGKADIIQPNNDLIISPNK